MNALSLIYKKHAALNATTKLTISLGREKITRSSMHC